MLEELERAAAELRPPSEGDADWLGRLDKVIRNLTELKRAVMAELAGPVRGSEYQVTEGRSASRSYNTAAILSAFGARGYELRDLLAVDAVRLSWRWSELKKAAAMANVDLHIAHHEIDDQGEIDGPLVGEVWRSQYRIEGA